MTNIFVHYGYDLSAKELNITQCYKKKKWSVAEARAAHSGSYGLYELTKQESTDRFLGSIPMREIFQFEVWNSSSFVNIFLFIEKSMKNFEIDTID